MVSFQFLRNKTHFETTRGPRKCKIVHNSDNGTDKSLHKHLLARRNIPHPMGTQSAYLVVHINEISQQQRGFR